jgi:uncharacterized membrane protein
MAGATMPDHVGQFEMRRLEALSNTIFGVAMTLLAYDLPKVSSMAGAPGWEDIFRTYAHPVMALVLSFVIAGLFWVSHQRRLAIAPEADRAVVFLNLLFLLSIIVLPVTNGLYGSYRASSVVGVIYGGHLTVIASLNAVLWYLAVKDRGRELSHVLIPATLPVVVFLFGTVVATVAPLVAQNIWFLGFLAPVLGWLRGRRRAV